MPILAAYGHSWVQGAGATTVENRLVEVTARELGLQPCNLGVGGSSSTGTAELLAHQPPPVAELYLLMTGLNDARLHGTDPAGLAAYSVALDVILRALRSAGPEARIIAVQQPHLLDYSQYTPHDQGSSDIVDRYNEQLRRSCAAPADVITTTVPQWDAESMLAADTVHPNDAGHAQIGRAVAHSYRSFSSTMASTRPVQD